MAGVLAIWRRSVCAVSGAIVGGFVGLVQGLALAAQPNVLLGWRDLLGMAVLLGFAGWVIVLIVVGLWLHYGALAIAAPSLVTAMITALLTVVLNDVLHIAPAAVFVGLLVGTLVGAFLCRLCDRPQERGQEATHGVR